MSEAKRIDRLAVKVKYHGNYSPKHCKKLLNDYYEKITKKKTWFKNTDHTNYVFLRRMELVYTTYRKYTVKCKIYKKDEKVAVGVLDHYRDLLTDLILNQHHGDDLNIENKICATNALIGQDSIQHLYRIARHDNVNNEQDSEFWEKENYGAKNLAEYIIDRFPDNCGDRLLNIATYWATSRDEALVKKAIKKIASPRLLMDLCLFLRENPDNLSYCKEAIRRIGELIEEYKGQNGIVDIKEKKIGIKKANKLIIGKEVYRKKSDSEIYVYKSSTDGELSAEVDEIIKKSQIKANVVIKKVKYKELDIKSESQWVGDHGLATLFYAHRSLENIIKSYADPSLDLNSETYDSEKELVVLAINQVIIPGFLDRVIKRISGDPWKKGECLNRKMKIDMDSENINIKSADSKKKQKLFRIMLRDNVGSLSELMYAVKNLDIDSDDDETKSLIRELEKRLENNVKGLPNSVPLDPELGYVICETLYKPQLHSWSPVEGQKNMQRCSRCGKTRNWSDYFNVDATNSTNTTNPTSTNNTLSQEKLQEVITQNAIQQEILDKAQQ